MIAGTPGCLFEADQFAQKRVLGVAIPDFLHSLANPEKLA